MKSKKHGLIRLLQAVLAAALLAGCGGPAAETPWTAAGVSEDFYCVAEDFAARFLTLDADGALYDRSLDAVARYLDGTVSRAEAQETVQTALADVEAALAAEETAVLEESLVEQLQAVGISSTEYELFANSRSSQLQTHQARLTSLDFYLDYAESQADALENLRFFLMTDQAEQDGMRGYYYYGCFNYWFPWADEAEQAYLQAAVTDRLEAYLPEEAAWYTDMETVEEQVMLYLDEVEAVIVLASEHLGQSQADLYEMEQDYAAQSAGGNP